jgi:hypothetical protein
MYYLKKKVFRLVVGNNFEAMFTPSLTLPHPHIKWLQVEKWKLTTLKKLPL